MNTSWMIDELAHAGPEHLDPAFIAGYDRKQGFPGAAGDLDVLAGHGVGERSTVLDMGAGTGQFAMAAAHRFEHVIAIDVSPVMVEQLRSRATEAGLSNVQCVLAGFLSYEHTGPAVDAVFTRNVLHHLPDFWKAVTLSRVARMLRPGGVLRIHDLIYDFQPDQAEDVFGRWFAGAATDPADGYTAEDYAEHIRTEYSTFRWLFEPMLDAAGFEIVDVEYTGAAFGAYTCLRRPV